MKRIVYVEMDVHSEDNCMAVYLDDRGEPEYESTIPNTEAKVQRFFQKLKEKYPDCTIQTIYEAGPTGFVLYRKLKEVGISCLVAAPSLLPHAPGDRRKTDRRDAKSLAKALRSGMATPCHIPSKEFEAVRDYQRMVADTKDAVGTAKKRLIMLLHRQDCPSYEGTYWTQRHLQWIKTVSLDPVDRETCDEYLMMVKELQDRLARQPVRLEEFAAMKEFSEEVAKLKCFKGISTQTALALVTEVEDFQRFPTARSFMAYLGLVTSEHSSGGRRIQGGITKAGTRHIRSLLVESSWHFRYPFVQKSRALKERQQHQDIAVVSYADKANNRLTRKFSKMTYHNKSTKTTVVAVAREMSGFVWGMMTDNIA